MAFRRSHKRSCIGGGYAQRIEHSPRNAGLGEGSLAIVAAGGAWYRGCDILWLDVRAASMARCRGGCVGTAWRCAGAETTAGCSERIGSSLGLGIAQWHAGDAAAPKLLKQLYARNIEGRVVELWALPKGQRLRLGSLSIARLGPAETPKYVRVSTRRSGVVSVGDRVRLRASLRSPSWPALPGSFDFERKAFFEQIGGYGFTLGAVSVIASENNPGLLARLSIGLIRLRQEIGLRIRNASSPSSGAIAQALMTGDRGSIVDADLEVMPDSGLAHLLAISGLHMGLMAATLFSSYGPYWRCRQRWRCVTRLRNMPPSDPWLARSPILR